MIAAYLVALLRRWLADELPTLDQYEGASCGADGPVAGDVTL